MDFSLFDEASRDYDREALERRTALVRVGVGETLMPFLALASSTEEYQNRKALASSVIHNVAMRCGSSETEVIAVADRMYGLLTEARRTTQDGLVYTATAMACANCDHKSTDHSEGLRCSCGCTNFTPSTSKESMRREAGEGSAPFS